MHHCKTYTVTSEGPLGLRLWIVKRLIDEAGQFRSGKVASRCPQYPLLRWQHLPLGE